MGTVELVNVRKSYGSVDVIHGIDLFVEDKEFVALVGPSGCGKSTLLRMIAGLESINTGEVRIAGERVNDKRPRSRDIAMVFQNYALYPHMTVRQNMDLNLRIAGHKRPEIEKRVARAAGLLELTDLLDRKPSQLSGGQRQRVAMGRALVRDPAVFLFDEPLSNLDAKLRVQMRSEIKALHEAVATTSIYVTHDQIEAMTLADRVVVLNAGRIEQIGSPTELYRRPDNVFVASFIGSPAMNLFDGIVTPDGTGILLSGSGEDVTLANASPLQPGRAVVVGIRPEDIVVHTDGALTGQALLVEPVGAHIQVKLELSNGKSMTVLVDNEQTVRRGDSLRLSAPKSKLHVFSADDQSRIE